MDGGNIMVPWGEGVEAPFARTGGLGCPLMFHFGEEDSNPSQDDMRKLGAELTRYGKEHEFHTYSDAGHAFMDFTNPQRYQETAAAAGIPRQAPVDVVETARKRIGAAIVLVEVH